MYLVLNIFYLKIKSKHIILQLLTYVGIMLPDIEIIIMSVPTYPYTVYNFKYKYIFTRRKI